MRLGNLPDGGHDKLIWSRERNRDGPRDLASQQGNSEMWWRRTTATLLGVSFGSYRRRRRDVLMGRGGYVPLRRLGDVPLRRHWVFHLRRTCDVTGTYRETSLRRRHDVLLPGGNFLFYFDFCIKFTLSTIISTMKKWYHLTWCVLWNNIKRKILAKHVT